MKSIPSLLIIAVAAGLALPTRPLPAQAPSAADVTVKELELKQKELDLEKARIEQQKVQQRAVDQAQLEVERQRMELDKARQALAVKETADQLQMALPGDILFDTGTAVLKPNAKSALVDVATVLAAYPGSRITVTGYADASGSRDVNLKLSRDRAEAVKAWLLAQSGISSDRVFTQGGGASDPVATNATAAGRQLNRRVDITVVKMPVAR